MSQIPFIPDFGSFGPFGYVVLFALSLVFSASLFLPVPVFAVVVAAASVLDPLLVGIIAGIASAIGELSGYFVGVAGETALKKKGKTGGFYQSSKDVFRKWGFWGIVFVTISPITLIDVMGIVAGALRYGWKRFLLAAIVGKIPRYVIIAYTGKIAIEASWEMASSHVEIAIGAGIIVALVAIYFWKFRKPVSKDSIRSSKQRT